MFSFVFILRISLKKFSSLFLSSSYDKSALIGCVVHLKSMIFFLLSFLRVDLHYFCLRFIQFQARYVTVNLLIIWRKALRDAILLEMTVVSSANCVSFVSCELGSLIPLQSLSCRSLIVKISTESMNRKRLGGHPCRTPLDTSLELIRHVTTIHCYTFNIVVEDLDPLSNLWPKIEFRF